MKRRLEDDIVLTETLQPFVFRKVNHYHYVFHVLYGLVRNYTIPMDVAFYIATYYFTLWSVPETAFEPIDNNMPCIHSDKNTTNEMIITFDTTDTEKGQSISAIAAEFSCSYHYRINFFYTMPISRALSNDDNLLMKLRFVYDMLSRIRLFYEGKINIYFSAEKGESEKVKRAIVEYTGEKDIIMYEKDHGWVGSNMHLLFKHDKPFSTSVSKELVAIISSFTQHVTIVGDNGYRVFYRTTIEKDISRYIYPLLITLKHHL